MTRQPDPAWRRAALHGADVPVGESVDVVRLVANDAGWFCLHWLSVHVRCALPNEWASGGLYVSEPAFSTSTSDSPYSPGVVTGFTDDPDFEVGVGDQIWWRPARVPS